eukprot:gb/GEZN01000872.1/.p1 GENE.gb/GEZN01000872.1/~~gb/GEZN01000872.1/.p1  ORF type:complete len:1124 (+),score=162.42 gb/GEZN01000872.1/:157-3528(+)
MEALGEQRHRKLSSLSDAELPSEYTSSERGSPVKQGRRGRTPSERARFLEEERQPRVESPADSQMGIQRDESHSETSSEARSPSADRISLACSWEGVASCCFLLFVAVMLLTVLMALRMSYVINKQVTLYVAQDSKDVDHVETILDWWDEVGDKPVCTDENGQIGVSVVVVSADQSHSVVSRLLPALVSYARVHEVVLSHSVERNSAALSAFQHPKVKHRLDYADARLLDMGRAARFKLAEISTSCDWVLLLDEDVLLSEDALDELLAYFANNLRKVVGKWGENKYLPPFFSPVWHYQGTVDVISTRLMLFRKSALAHFFRVMQRYGLQHGFEDTRKTWEGEDVFFSLVNRLVYGELNFAMPSLQVQILGHEQRLGWQHLQSWYTRCVLWGVTRQLVRRLDKAPRDLLQITKGHQHGHGMAMEGSDRDLHFITFASNLHGGYLPSLQAELRKFEVPFHIIHTTQYPGPAMHTRQILGQACNLPGDTIVVKVDAYDTIISGDPRSMVEKFKNSKALFVAGWMNPVLNSPLFYEALWGWPEHSQCQSDVGLSFEANRYLCSGTWLTYAHFACKLRCAYEEVQDNFASDQLVLSRIMHKFPALIKLDCDNEFFFSIKPIFSTFGDLVADTVGGKYEGRNGSYQAYLKYKEENGHSASVTHFIDCTPIDGFKNPGCDPTEHTKKGRKFFDLVLSGRAYANRNHAKVTRQMELCMDNIYSTVNNPSNYHMDASAKKDLMLHERSMNHTLDSRYSHSARIASAAAGARWYVGGLTGHQHSHATPSDGPKNETKDLPRLEGGGGGTTMSGLVGMKVMVINRNTRLDRLDNTIALLNRLGVPPDDWEVVRPTPSGIACALLEYMGFDNVARFSDNQCSLVHTYVRIWQDMNSSVHEPDHMHFAILQDDMIEAVPAAEMRSVLLSALQAAPRFHVLHLDPCHDWCFLQEDHGAWKTMHMPRCLGAAVFRRDTAVELPGIIKHTPASGLDSMLGAHPHVIKLGTPLPLFQQYTLGLSSDLYGVQTSWLQEQINILFPHYACTEWSWKAGVLLSLFLFLLCALLFSQVECLYARLPTWSLSLYMQSLTHDPITRKKTMPGPMERPRLTALSGNASVETQTPISGTVSDSPRKQL